MTYLDNSATTSLDPEVFEAMKPYLQHEYGNASSAHEIGRRAKVALEAAREAVADFIGADSREIVFTSSGTEANNAAIAGPIFYRHFAGQALAELRVVTSRAEHNAVLEPINFLGDLGVQPSFAEVDSGGHVSLDGLRAVTSAETSLISLMLVNNEVGSINPIVELGKLARAISPKIVIHTDAVQALGKMPIDIRALGVDLASFSAHKIHGPKGVGALYIRSGTKMEPFVHGGAQERNRRGGTESVALATGFAKACTIARERMTSDVDRVAVLGRELRNLVEAIPGIVLNSPESDWLPWIVNFSFAPELIERIDGEAILIRFDLEGIALSNGSACTSGSMQPSHVLIAMGKGEEIASKSVRVSLSHHTTELEIERFLDVLQRIMPR